MKVCSLNCDGGFNKVFYALLSAGKLTNIRQRFDFNFDAVVLEGTVCNSLCLKGEKTQ